MIHNIIEWISIVFGSVGFFMIVGTVGTDDFYTMELHTSRPIDWKMMLIGAAVIIASLLIGWLNETYDIQIHERKRKHGRKQTNDM